MANDWFNRDPLWGGETFDAPFGDDLLGIKDGDIFRIETDTKNGPALIPDPTNSGDWKDAHNKNNPVYLTLEESNLAPGRVHSIKVTRSGATQKYYIWEKPNGATVITKWVPPASGEGGTASVRR